MTTMKPRLILCVVAGQAGFSRRAACRNRTDDLLITRVCSNRVHAWSSPLTGCPYCTHCMNAHRRGEPGGTFRADVARRRRLDHSACADAVSALRTAGHDA